MKKKVLSDEIRRMRRNRTVRYALFTTYNFDPGFFELQILPLLFDEELSQDEDQRRVQLSYLMRDVHEIEVYYDYNQFTAGHSAHLDYRRVPVRYNEYTFHPKTLFLLVEDGQGQQSLVVGAGSVNISQSGYWENLECYHLTEVTHKDETVDSGFAAFLQKVAEYDKSDGDTRERLARKAIIKFLNDRKQSTENYFYYGGEQFFSFLERHVPERQSGYSLEIISPYLYRNSDMWLFEKFFSCIPGLKNIKVFLPKNAAGKADCTDEYFEKVSESDNITWCTFTGNIQSGYTAGEPIQRFLHAKLYRLVCVESKIEIMFCGSVNFTGAGTLDKNFEAGFLVYSEEPGTAPLLQKIDKEPVDFAHQNTEESTISKDTDYPFVALHYDWRQQVFSYFAEAPVRSDKDKFDLTFSDNANHVYFEVKLNSSEQRIWEAVEFRSDQDREKFEAHLKSGSFLFMKCNELPRKTLLVQEAGMSHKPSLVGNLTPRQIFQLWNRLESELKMNYLAAICGIKEIYRSDEYRSSVVSDNEESFFSKFSQIYRAFDTLQKHVDRAVDLENSRSVEYYLFGSEIDSLPELLKSLQKEKSHADREVEENVHIKDPVLIYIVALSSEQLLNMYRHRKGSFWEPLLDRNKQRINEIDNLIAALKTAGTAKLNLGELEERRKDFLEWYENIFLNDSTGGVDE